MIEINSLHKKYGQRTILKDINLKIPKGKLVSLIGPNGAGKSTLLSIIARLEKIDQGSVKLDGQELSHYALSSFSTKLSFLKQQNSLDLKLKVAELIAFGRFPYSKGQLNPRDIEIVNEAMERMNLSHLCDAFIDEISGGERQRVFLAMIIAQDTDYILLDEPLNNLDMKHAVEIMQIATRLVREFNKTVIMVVHDINFAANYSDYMIGMKAGEIVFMDKTDSIMGEGILRSLFDIDFRIIKDGSSLLCNYYKI
ncbi:ABC transporter ATP-binding protein [Pedobacter antarcticus]|uniref:iron ABC transporter ATP-binding protein n=1 Tax=Pedobacter antarcticus TaxID=34086 RepID=UPI001C594E05|nr:ATP-binding cassette domain-containing protein [Pedobacter antarcticus]